MKAYKVELLIINFDDLTQDQIISEIENVRYPNDCITPRVMLIKGEEIGEWEDDHPLNHNDKIKDEYARLF